MTIKILVVDDSAFMRTELSRIIEMDPQLTVVATAKEGVSALEKIRKYQPDVVTLDINMPGMGGIECLRHIMRYSPLPVVMISVLTKEGAELTLDALNLGAFDFIQKPSGSISIDIAKQGEIIRKKLKNAGLNKVSVARLNQISPELNPTRNLSAYMNGTSDTPRKIDPDTNVPVVCVGVSTGGPKTLTSILPMLPKNLAASVIIAQHMPEKFTSSFARRLDEICSLSVKEPEHLEPVKPGTIYIAPGGCHTTLAIQPDSTLVLQLSEPGDDQVYIPSIDLLFRSCVQTLQNRWIGVMLTGMGSDGAKVLAEHHQAGGSVIVEHESSCVVYGMPKRTLELGGADFILPHQEIPAKLVEIIQNLEPLYDK